MTRDKAPGGMLMALLRGRLARATALKFAIARLAIMRREALK